MNINIIVTVLLISNIGALAEKDLDLDADSNRMRNIIENSLQTFKEHGYDPFWSEGNKRGTRYNYVLPGGINLYGYYENFMLKGISDILINNMFAVEDLLTLDIFIPRLEASVDHIYIEMALGNFYRKIEVQGRLIVNNVSLISRFPKQYDKLSINGLSVDIHVKNIESNLTVKIGGVDYSSSVNDFMEQNLPSILSYPFHIMYELLSLLVLIACLPTNSSEQNIYLKNDVAHEGIGKNGISTLSRLLHSIIK